MTTQRPADEQPIHGPQAAVELLMTRTVARISPSANLFEVAEKLAAVEVGALVVGTVDEVTGIVSERDVTHALGLGEDPYQQHAEDIASHNLVWCDIGATVAEASRLMCEYGVRHLLVRDDELRGIVSARDLLYAYVH
jgi:CBS domain-containing protein